MNRTTLLALASRVEAMRGPTCVVDVEIAIAVGYAGENSEGARDIRADPDDDGWLLFEMAGEACECCNRAPPYTSSLDAAMSLVPSMDCADWDEGIVPAYFSLSRSTTWESGPMQRGWAAILHPVTHETIAEARASTPALALTASSLRAIAGSLPND